MLKHARKCQAKGTLVVPLWRSASFWPLLCVDRHQLSPFIHDWADIPLSGDTLIPGKQGSTLFKGMPNTRILALKFDFSISPRRGLQGKTRHKTRDNIEGTLAQRV